MVIWIYPKEAHPLPPGDLTCLIPFLVAFKSLKKYYEYIFMLSSPINSFKKISSAMWLGHDQYYIGRSSCCVCKYLPGFQLRFNLTWWMALNLYMEIVGRFQIIDRRKRCRDWLLEQTSQPNHGMEESWKCTIGNTMAQTWMKFWLYML